MRYLLTSVSVIASLAAAGFAYAGPGPGPDGGPGKHGGHGGHDRGGAFMHELRDLDLTDAQKTQIRDMSKASRTQSADTRGPMRELQHRYLLAVPGSAEYRTLTAQVADAEASQARERVQSQAELRTRVYAVLTAEQKKKLATELAARPLPSAPPARPAG